MWWSSTMKPARPDTSRGKKRTRPTSAKASIAIACALRDQCAGAHVGAGPAGDFSGGRRFHVIVTWMCPSACVEAITAPWVPASFRPNSSSTESGAPVPAVIRSKILCLVDMITLSIAERTDPPPGPASRPRLRPAPTHPRLDRNPHRPPRRAPPAPRRGVTSMIRLPMRCPPRGRHPPPSPRGETGVAVAAMIVRLPGTSSTPPTTCRGIGNLPTRRFPPLANAVQCARFARSASV